MSSSTYIHPDSLHRIVSHHLKVGERFSRAGIQVAGFTRLKGPFHVRRNQEPYHAFFYQAGGRGTLGEGPARRRVATGTVALARAFSDHFYESRLRWDKIWFHLDPGKWILKEGNPADPFLVRPARHLKDMHFYMEALFREIDHGEDRGDGILERLADLVVLTLRREWDPNPETLHPDRTGLEALTRLIRAKPAAPWNLEEMARSFPRPVSPNHLYKICMKHGSKSPRELLMQVRMECAAEFLSDSLLNLEQVGAMVGYANAFAFSAAYKRCTGRAPSADRPR